MPKMARWSIGSYARSPGSTEEQRPPQPLERSAMNDILKESPLTALAVATDCSPTRWKKWAKLPGVNYIGTPACLTAAA